MNVILLVLAIVCYLVASLLGFAVVDGGHVLGWLGAAGAFLSAAFLVPQIPRP